jgi:hypothetical protein
MTELYKQATRYDLSTGRLLGRGQYAIDAQPQIGQGHLDGQFDLDGQYYDIETRTVKDRLPSGAILSSESINLGESVTLSNLPIPCNVSVQFEPVEVDDGVLEITPQSVGEAYRIIINEVAYLREKWFFEVV